MKEKGKILLKEEKDIQNMIGVFKKNEIIYISLDEKEKYKNFINLNDVIEFRLENGIKILPNILLEIIRDVVSSYSGNIKIIIIEIDKILENFTDKSKIQEFFFGIKSLSNIFNISIILLTNSKYELIKKYEPIF